MLRSAAKNYAHTTVITDPQDYKLLMEELKKNNGSISLEFREKQAMKVFNSTAYYDAVIADYFNKKFGIDETQNTAIPIVPLQKLRY
jgi:phosphoribosylaminoimidazolecarboxamide formyltransferase/IMP cyclohydrolase